MVEELCVKNIIVIVVFIIHLRTRDTESFTRSTMNTVCFSGGRIRMQMVVKIMTMEQMKNDIYLYLLNHQGARLPEIVEALGGDERIKWEVFAMVQKGEIVQKGCYRHFEYYPKIRWRVKI